MRIVLNNLPFTDAHKDFVKRKPVGLCFFVGVVGDAYSIVAYGVNDVFQIHVLFPSTPAPKAHSALLPPDRFLVYHSSGPVPNAP